MRFFKFSRMQGIFARGSFWASKSSAMPAATGDSHVIVDAVIESGE